MRSINFATGRNQPCRTIFKNKRVCDECISSISAHRSAEVFETRPGCFGSRCRRTRLAAISSAVRLAFSFCTQNEPPLNRRTRRRFCRCASPARHARRRLSLRSADKISPLSFSTNRALPFQKARETHPFAPGSLRYRTIC